MSETAIGAGSGAVSGAATGAVVGSVIPGVGTLAGAIVGGLIGSTWGGISGSFGDKSKKKAKQAKQALQLAAMIQQQREEEAYRQNLLAEIRSARLQRSSSLAAAVAAGVEEGSGAQGALSAIGSGIANLVEYMSVDRGRAVQIGQLQTYSEHLSNKAQKLSKKSQTSAQAMNTTFALAGMGASLYSMAGAASATNAANAASTSGTGYSTASGFGSGAANQAAGAKALSTPFGTVGLAQNQATWTAAANQLQSQAQMQLTASSMASHGYSGYRYKR